MLTISALSLSGGQGKSTVILFLAKLLADAGLTVLCIDCDPQSNLTTFLEVDLQPNSPTLLEVLKGTVEVEDGIYPCPSNDKLFLIPADDGLEAAQDYLSTSGIGALMLRKRLENLRGEFDVVLIDPPPQRYQMTKTIIVASDEIIIPVEPNVKGFGSLLRTLNAIDEFIQLKICSPNILGILPFRDRWYGLSQSKESRLWLDQMKAQWAESYGEVDDGVFLPPFRHSTRIEYAIANGLSLDQVASDSEYSLDHPFQVIAERISAKVGKKEKEKANV